MNNAEFEHLCDLLEQETLVVVDTETTGVNPYQGDTIAGIAYYFPERDKSFYVDIFHEGINKSEAIRLRELNYPANVTHIMFNAKFDMHMLHKLGIPLANHTEDVLIAAQLLNENEALSHGKREGAFGLKRLAGKYLGAWALEGEDDLKAQAKERGLNPKEEMWKMPASAVAKYATMDVIITWELREFYRPHLENWGQWDLYQERNEFNYLYLYRAEQNGMLVDQERLQTISEDILAGKETGYAFFQKVARDMGLSDDFNVNSPSQVLTLFQLKGIPLKATNKQALAAHQQHELVQHLQKYREFDTQHKLYTKKYPSFIDQSGYMHPSFYAPGLVTGRISCRAPNMQQIPKDGDIKDIFTAPPGYALVQWDYGNMEYRLAAFFSGDKELTQLFHEGRDMHQYTADELTQLLGRVVERHEGKTANFSLLYGTGARSASRKWNVPFSEAKEIVNGWREVFKDERKAYQNAMDLATRWRNPDGGGTGGQYQYVRLFNGRVRHYQERLKYPNLEGHDDWPNPKDAFNVMVQGTGAAILEASATRVARYFPDNRYFKPCNAVHDSLMAYVHRDWIDIIVPEVARMMSDWPMFDPPMIVEPELSFDSWKKLEPTKWIAENGNVRDRTI